MTIGSKARPQKAMKRTEEELVKEVKLWQSMHSKASSASVCGKVAGNALKASGKGHNWLKKGVLPPKVDLDAALVLRPAVAGARIWFEHQTDRFRASYMRAGVRVTASWPSAT